MTGRTHDLAAFTALSLIISSSNVSPMSLGTVLVAFSANMIGGLAPDLDEPTTDFWHHLPAGTFYSRLISPLLGGHRYISHSLVGVAIFGFITYWALVFAHSFLIVDISIVWWSFMIGYISHLVMDTITIEGVPWLFPIPIKFGIPPFAFLRIKTGGLVEKSVIFPGLLVFNIYLIYHNYSHFLFLFHKLK